MSLRYFVPQASTPSYVHFFGILEEPHTVFNKRIVLADPHPALMINVGAPLVWETDGEAQVELPRAFLIRAQTKPLKLRGTGIVRVIGLNLAAWGSRLLVDEQTDLTNSPIISLDSDATWRDITRSLTAALRREDELQAVSIFDQFMADRRHAARIDTAVIRAALDLLSTHNGQCSLTELAEHCYLSPSQLERHAKYFTGQAPKMLARLIRFEASCAGLLNDPESRLTDLAHQFGYVDQAHFVHEFRTFADCTPRKAREYVRQLAADAEFLQFS